MTLVLWYLLLALLTLGGVALHKAYTHIPQRELKRRARGGDELARLLYSAASYGSSLEILLWVIIGLSASGFFLVVDRSLPTWGALTASLALVWLGFAWLPNTPVSKLSFKFARLVAQPLAWTLHKLYPFISWFASSTGKWRITFHTGLYEKEDLVDFLEAQAEQADSRLSLEELNLAKNSLLFGDKMVREIMTPRSKVKMVSADETVGPLLMTELHDSGHGIFPVRTGKKSSEIVGTLYLNDVMDARAGGQVRDIMRHRVFYMNDETTLDNALRIFLKSKHHLFVVVNSLEDVVGIVTVEDILEQIVGQSLEDELDHFDNPKDVAHSPAGKSSKPASASEETVVESE